MPGCSVDHLPSLSAIRPWVRRTRVPLQGSSNADWLICWASPSFALLVYSFFPFLILRCKQQQLNGDFVFALVFQMMRKEEKHRRRDLLLLLSPGRMWALLIQSLHFSCMQMPERPRNTFFPLLFGPSSLSSGEAVKLLQSRSFVGAKLIGQCYRWFRVAWLVYVLGALSVLERSLFSKLFSKHFRSLHSKLDCTEGRTLQLNNNERYNFFLSLFHTKKLIRDKPVAFRGNLELLQVIYIKYTCTSRLPFHWKVNLCTSSKSAHLSFVLCRVNFSTERDSSTRPIKSDQRLFQLFTSIELIVTCNPR